MMQPSRMEDLQELHKAILGMRAAYQPPEHLMQKVNAQYREYMHGRDGAGYYPWLALAIRLSRPKRILELGNYLGASTLMLYSEIQPETELFLSVDLVRNVSFVPESVLADPRMRFVFGDALNLNIYGDPFPLNFEFVFIDTLHERQHLEAEWTIYQHLCAPGALVVLDDIRLNDLWEFWENLPYPKLDITADCHPSGFGIFVYLPSRDHAQDDTRLRAYRAALEVARRRLEKANRELDGLRELCSRSPLLARTVDRVRSVARRMWISRSS